MPKEKFYAIRDGPKPGVYKTWDEAKTHCIGIKSCSDYTAPKFKSFPTIKEAWSFIRGSEPTPVVKQSIKTESTTNASVWDSWTNPPAKSLKRLIHDDIPELENSPKKKTKTTKNSHKTFQKPQTPDPTGKTICYTDGASTGKHSAKKAHLRKSGIGVYFPDHPTWNISEPLGNINTRAESGKTSTNQTAEMEAIHQALRKAQENSVEKLIIRTDSMYCLNCLTIWWGKWVRNDWKNSAGKHVIHKEQIVKCLKIMETVKTEFEKVKGHSGDAGNDMADRLATEGAKKDLKTET